MTAAPGSYDALVLAKKIALEHDISEEDWEERLVESLANDAENDPNRYANALASLKAMCESMHGEEIDWKGL